VHLSLHFQDALSDDFCNALSLYIKKVIEHSTCFLFYALTLQQLLRIGKRRGSRGGGKAEVTAVKEKSIKMHVAR
jgi:hypothetical protein